MEAIRYIVDMLLWLLLLAFVLRLLFQLVRADFRDPMADAIVRVTNWLILPLRKLLPPIGKIDTATVVAVLLVAGARTFIIMALARRRASAICSCSCASPSWIWWAWCCVSIFSRCCCTG